MVCIYLYTEYETLGWEFEEDLDNVGGLCLKGGKRCKRSKLVSSS